MAADLIERDRAIDAFRLVMAVAVIVLHSIPQNLVGRTPVLLPAWTPFVDILCRAAVPFFFVVSGYYVRTGAGLWQRILRPIRRITPVYLFWLLVYLFLAQVWWGGTAPLRWTAIFDGGPAFHLWFLPALAVSLVVIPPARERLGVRATGCLVAMLALIGPILFAYHRLLGIETYPWRLSLIVRQLAAPAFVFIGMQLQGRARVAPGAALLLALGSYLALLGEALLLSRSSRAFVDFDVLLWTYMFGPATFLLARSLSAWRWPDPVVQLGRLSLGIYVTHLAFIWEARRLFPGMSPGSVTPLVAIALAGSILVSLGLDRSKILRRLVS